MDYTSVSRIQTRCCAPLSEHGDSRLEPTPIETHANLYQRRARRRTREGRYEPKDRSEVQKGDCSSEVPRKRKTLGRNDGNSRIGEKFSARNVTAGRLTINSNENLGIFKRGKTSTPVHCADDLVSYLNFSESNFLAKKPQTPNCSGKRGYVEGDQIEPSSNDEISCRFGNPFSVSGETKSVCQTSTSQLKSDAEKQLHKSENQSFNIEYSTNRTEHEPRSVNKSFRELYVPKLSENDLKARENAFEYWIEKQLYESLISCYQLTIPYEEYETLNSGSLIYTLEDLKKLCIARGYFSARTAVDTGDEYTRSLSEESFRAENTLSEANQLYTQSLAPELIESTPSSTDVKDVLLELLLDTDLQSTDDMAIQILEDVMDSAKFVMNDGDPYSSGKCMKSSRNAEFDSSPFHPTSLERPWNNFLMKEPFSAGITSRPGSKKRGTGFASILPLGGQRGQRSMPSRVTDQSRKRTFPSTILYESQNLTPPQRRFWRRNKLY
ncbi:hypothetical protein BGW36DRAFT_214435 [Talaromyces proteolyticus]|uniref:Uncharacterized protein n=1 Tax=Talaromyces proteolyticus TaxID=1131652 RepID=A0AAD4KQS5_9EURO|nr:uncharacterized protein BGW36DRAFT_214435 [Talaromyces proteolyticus]KAH8694019.1 hypothetical protein BGW36DRAFT_214435 [Talaromyces proteolyticus]